MGRERPRVLYLCPSGLVISGCLVSSSVCLACLGAQCISSSNGSRSQSSSQVRKQRPRQEKHLWVQIRMRHLHLRHCPLSPSRASGNEFGFLDSSQAAFLVAPALLTCSFSEMCRLGRLGWGGWWSLLWNLASYCVLGEAWWRWV